MRAMVVERRQPLVGDHTDDERRASNSAGWSAGA
jgi:hypothetical protein